MSVATRGIFYQTFDGGTKIQQVLLGSIVKKMQPLFSYYMHVMTAVLYVFINHQLNVFIHLLLQLLPFVNSQIKDDKDSVVHVYNWVYHPLNK